MTDFVNTVDVLGDDVVLSSIIEGSITEFKDNTITKLGTQALRACGMLHTLEVPNVIELGPSALSDCIALIEVDFPNVVTLGSYAFQNCTELSKINIPKVTRLTTWLFLNCRSLKHIDISNVTHIDGNAFRDAGLVESVMPKVVSLSGSTHEGCTNLKYADIYLSPDFNGNVFNRCSSLVAVIIRGDEVCSLSTTAAFNNTPIANGEGYIYVPRALLSDDDETMDYRRATNWSNYAAQFRAIEDYTVDGTVMGTFPRCSGVTLDQTALTFDEWAVQTLTATIATPSPIGLDTVVWKSADESIAQVADGVVAPVSKGSTTITATCNGYSATCEVVVNCEGVPMWYSLAEPTTFNGSSDYIDTGVQLFTVVQDFTIICEAEFSKLTTNNICLFHCMNEASPYPGLNVDGSGGIRIAYTGSNSLTTTIANRADVSALAIRYVDGKLDAIRYRNASGNIVTHAVSGTPTYTKVTQNLLLGAYQTTAGVKGRFFNGTISRFDVYATALSDEQIEALL